MIEKGGVNGEVMCLFLDRLVVGSSRRDKAKIPKATIFDCLSSYDITVLFS
jgi:hypothetical protein